MKASVKKPLVRITSALLFSFGLCNCSHSQGIPNSANTISELEASLQQLVNAQTPPGLSVVIVKEDRVVYSKAFGKSDIPQDKPATPQTVYQWWSVTKPFTATAILQLHEKGKLHIDDPVSAYLPFFGIRKSEKATREITIRQLLSHSAGLDDIGMKILGWIHYEGNEAFNQTNLVKTQMPCKLSARPGEEGRYSNLGYMVLAAIIEQVSGQSYDSYINNHILAPLEMNHSGFSYSPQMKRNAAAGSHPRDFMSLLAFTMIDKEKAVREKKDGIYWFNPLYSNQQGSTGLIGSTEDLSHFMIAMLNGGVWKDKKILSQESIDLMQQPQIAVRKSLAPGLDDVQFGLSWFIHKEGSRKALSHGGAGAAFVAHMRLFPENKTGIAILANSTYLGEDRGSAIVSRFASLEWDIP